ncbi:MAG: hypothetical protein IAA73_05390, partial [Bacteroidetes bacterium]|nr:hypothetical protein [Candidatus Gallipaludibacter merdavium]
MIYLIMNSLRLSAYILLVICLCLGADIKACQTLRQSLHIVIYVSPKGNDHASGTLKQPLRSIRAALERIQDTDEKQQAEIILREGTYEQDATLVINRDNVCLHPYKD